MFSGSRSIACIILAGIGGKLLARMNMEDLTMSSVLPVVITPDDTTDVVVVSGELRGVRWKGMAVDTSSGMRGTVDSEEGPRPQ